MPSDTNFRVVRLIHSNAAEAKDRKALLQAAGYRVVYQPLTPDVLQRIRKTPPDAVVIDLNRSPSLGRDVGLAIRHQKRTRQVPLVFAGGAAEKVDRVKRVLPDAVFTTWSRVGTAVKRAIAHPPRDPVAPDSVFAGYSGTPLPKKLGIKADSVVLLVNAPKDFERTLGDLPPGAVLKRRTSSAERDLVIWFTRSRQDLDSRIAKLASAVGDGGLWIVWPKKRSASSTDITQNDVRRVGLAAGLVDYKICAVDETWSGLKFARRKPK